MGVATTVERGEKRPKTGAMVNGAAALVLLLVIALVAISQAQAPPPAIAEISPDALKTIQQAPNNQSSRFGEGAGGNEGGITTTTEPDRTPAVVVPRTRKCVGNPPRQIEDPQSPPCVPYFVGDNGGATWKGVTRDTINVVIPNYDTGNVALTTLYESFFNHRFEFYGRKMKIIDGSAVTNGDPASDEAAAATFDEQYHAFAVGAGAPDDYYMYAALARRGIVAENTEIAFTDADMNQKHNVYQYFMGVDSVFANQGNWACSRLAGGNAVHGGPLVQNKKRVFGIIMVKAWQDNPVSPKPLEDELAKCGEKSAKTITFTFNASSFPIAQLSPADATNAMVQMRDAGVTSLFYLGGAGDENVLMNAATGQGYIPEWLIGSYIDIDNNLIMHGSITDPNQLNHAFGISIQPRVTTGASMPAVWAAQEEDPTYQFRAGDQLAFAAKQYWAIFEIAAGIQMAGPHLTAATFEAGLRRALFPNPITKIMIGAAGFNDALAAHSMTKDGAEIYWDPKATDGAGGAGSGAWCYVAGGARHHLGTWPKGGDPFFKGPCDNGAQVTAGPYDQ